MLRHALLLSLRHFKRFRSSFFINLVGLSTGLACTLMIYLWVNDELRVDTFHENDSRLYQVMRHQPTPTGIVTSGYTPAPIAEALAREMPEVEYAVLSWRASTFPITKDDRKIKAQGIYASENYFRAFSYNVVQGNSSQILKDINSIVISESLALTLFNTTNGVIGKTVSIGTDKAYRVSGVFKGTPANSSTQFDFALSFEDFRKDNAWLSNWNSNGPINHVVLKEGSNLELLNKKVAGLIQRNSADAKVTLFLKPYSENYLYGKYEDGQLVGGRIEYIKLFSIIAFFVLTIACVNFMNLSTAKASRRLKEVGIKKALGADRRNLVYQFLGESLLITIIALLVALLLVAILLPEFNLITGKQLSLRPDTRLLLSMLAITLCTGILSGSYPALYLSGFNPLTILKGKLSPSSGEVWARKGLVIFQFALSIIFITSVLVVYRQIGYVQSKNLGYFKDNIICFGKEGRINDNLDAFLAEVKRVPGVVNASSIGHNLLGSNMSTEAVEWAGKAPEQEIMFENVPVSCDMIEMLGIEMKEGRPFSRKYSTDTATIIFNEAALKAMGISNPLGRVVKLWGKDRQIIGVTKNFHFESLHQKVKPLFFVLEPPETWTVMVKMGAGQEQQTLERLKALYQSYNDGFPFEYSFLDQDYQTLYMAEQQVSVLSRYFAGLALLISCLGLFGLAAFTAEKRRKEISIRKVLGASESGIFYLLTSSFTKLVLVSIVIALPISYLLVSKWLGNFAYHINLKWWYFALAGVLTLLITWLTVSLQALKAARINPAQSLKDG